jgi:hypothetical protein
LEANKENTMAMRIAILAAFAATLALAQPEFALANYTADSVTKRTGSTPEVGPEHAMRLALLVNTSHSNIGHRPCPPECRPAKRTRSVTGTARPTISDKSTGGSESKKKN